MCHDVKEIEKHCSREAALSFIQMAASQKGQVTMCPLVQTMLSNRGFSCFAYTLGCGDLQSPSKSCTEKG